MCRSIWHNHYFSFIFVAFYNHLKIVLPLSRSVKLFLLILLVLVLDQWLKIWVKTHMNYDDSIDILGFAWAKLRFVENDGMAFGIELGGIAGKYALSIFRIIAVIFLLFYLKQLEKKGASMGLLVSFALVLAGAIGNILDSAFYGMIFSESPYHGGIATLFPEAGGYSGFLRGKVVDMFYFEIARGYFPAWFPFWQGEEYVFFRPVFNIADAAITTGVLSIILFYRRFFNELEEKEEQEKQAQQNTANAAAAAALTTEQTSPSEESSELPPIEEKASPPDDTAEPSDPPSNEEEE